VSSRPADPTIISTERLNLLPIPPAALRLLLGRLREQAQALLGVALPDEFASRSDDGFFQIQLDRMEESPQERDWMVRLMVLKGSPTAIGNIGFHGPPEVIGRAELGYTVYDPWRRQGFAIEAIRAMLAFAARRGSRSVFISISPGNGPSLALAERLGFRQVGVQEDEVDGTELVFELPVGAATA
jgi:RimJ/RimL family protein N-acetyltransferase